MEDLKKITDIDPIDIFTLASIKKIAEETNSSYTKTRDVILEWEKIKAELLPEFIDKLNK